MSETPYAASLSGSSHLRVKRQSTVIAGLRSVFWWCIGVSSLSVVVWLALLWAYVVKV